MTNTEQAPGTTVDPTPPPGAMWANLARWLVIIGLAVAAGASWWNNSAADLAAASHSHAHDDDSSYTCPMHPTYVSDRPGNCPICGMDLVPAASLKVEQPKDPSSYVLADLPGVAPVVIATERLQRAGVRTEKIARRLLEGTETFLAVVRRDAARNVTVEARTAGWVEWARPIQSGDRVKKGEVLVRLYSREVEVAQSELRAAKAAAAVTEDAGSAEAIRAEATRKVRALGAGAGGQKGGVTVRAARSGVVVSWQARSGSYVSPGQAMGTIADPEAVQVEAELPGLLPPQDDEVWTAHWQGSSARLKWSRSGEGSPSGRGGLGRFAFAETTPPSWPDGAQVVLHRTRLRSDALVVARAAVVEADGRSWVYRRAPSGRLWPTAVVLGLHDGQAVEVLSGLQEGEEVVVHGAFLVDAEARLAPLPADPSALTTPAPADTAAHAPGHGAAPAAAKPLSAEALAALLDATEAMASDDEAQAAAALARLAAASGEPLPFSPTLSAARDGWQVYLQRLWPALRATPAAQALHVAFCPMAPGSWLQRQTDVRNPYFGAKMLRCGAVQGTVATLVAAPVGEGAQ